MENEAVIINKYESIQRCIKRIEEEYDGNIENLYDYKKLDSIVLNFQRACESVIDIAMYIVANRKLGIPQSKKDAFVKLEENKLISKEMSSNMQKMIGLRNIAIYDYKEIDEEVLQDVIKNHLTDLIDFAKEMLNLER
jgi:uncharacterized protein YutE (UPF0331/DUF86 family)